MADGARAPSPFDRAAMAALGIYLGLSFFFFGRGLVGHFSTSYVGRGPDPPQSIWFIAWWAYAFTHRLNPFFTRLLFAPAGANLSWSTMAPLAALTAVPITLWFGPVAAYNALCLIAPTMAGWAAFVLCRWLSRGYWSSLAAGWVFGFSAYTVSAITTHLHTLLVFPIPLIVWLSLRYAAGELHRRRLVATVALLIFAQFMFCAEIVATAALVGALFFTVVYALGSETTRHSLMRLPAPLAAACGIAAVFLSPYLYFMFAFGHPGGVVLNPEYHGADLLNLLVPTGVNELGKLGALAAISRTYRATLTESGSYLPLPLVVIALLFGRERWAEPTARALIYSIIATCVLAMGARFVIGGHPTFGAPWYLLTRLPLLRKALPVRLMMYVFLGLAVIATMWLSTTRRSALLRASLAIGLLPFMMPNLSTSYWSSAFEIPEFFSSGAYRQYLEPGENVMVVPALIYGDGMQWQ